MSFVTPMASARGHFHSRNKEASSTQDNDKAVATAGAPSRKRLPDIDEARGRQHAPPKAPPAIPSSRPRWTPSSLPGRLIPPAVPVVPQVITGNTESLDVAFNDQNDSSMDVSFAAQHSLLASAAAGLRDTLPPIYWSAAIPPIISDAYSMIFASAGLIQQEARVRRKGMSGPLKQPPLEPQAYANGFSLASPPAPVPFERLVISEFRFRGPAGVADEYIQLTNITGQSITVSTADGSSGWALAAISPSGTTSMKFVIPNGTVFPQGAHYLAANSAYSLTGYATADRSYTGDIIDNTGIALFRTANPVNFTTNERIDAVGFTPVTNSLYREGSGLTAITAGTNEYAHVRKMATPLPQDTDNNSADFVTISTSTASLGGVAPVLGAPGPENSLSPLDRTSQIVYESLDPGAGATAPPNRVRNMTPVPNGALGTLVIRSKITNNTGFPITRMRFRIFDFTTTNSPVVTTPPQAVLTMLDSADSNITLSNGTTVSVKGSKVEQPPNQPNAGGINSTHAPGGITLTTPLQPGQSFYREMKFGVNANGYFRYNATVELLLSGGASADPSQDNFSAARLDPANRTGSSGEDLASRNLNWSLPLVSLPGRAGLDLGLSLAYNSLVWTKSLGSGSAIRFDADNGFPGPGFRMGFPVIERRYYDSSTATNAFLMITPSGRRVQLRQIGTSNVYETGDSSFMQLTDNGNTLLVRPTDGSQLSYSLIGDAYYCTQIKDRNGNFINASYGAQGQLLSVLDTLGRIINFNYDSFQNLLSITQTRNIGTPSQFVHTWATFGYTDWPIETNFGALTKVGPGNGSMIPALKQVGLADGTKYNFTYNTWGQVYRIGRSTPRSDEPALYQERNYVSYNLPQDATGSSQSDCPRFTERRVWAENWNGDSNGSPVAGEEALTTLSPHNFAGGVTTVTVPDGTQYKEFFVGASPTWQRGLTTQTETWSGGVRRKWTTVSWTQDNTSLAYQKNPRVIETNIYDEVANRKRTTIDYGTYVTYGLPYLITEYGIGGNGIMRQTYIDYNLNSAYVSQRIIGLVSAQQVSNGSAWQSKTVYSYDAGGAQLVATSAPAIQHDAAYGTGFLGRGNVTSVARYDVNDINNETKALTTTIGYDVDGSVVFTGDPSTPTHQNSLSYTDSFADGLARNTFAYPTTATDAGGYTSTSKYSFDTGSLTQTQTPQPNTTANQPGPIQTVAYDAIGRIQRVTSLTNGAFTEFVYPQDLMMVQSFTTIRDDSIGNPSLRAYSAKTFDGAGRVIGTIASHPGSNGGYTAQDINYDVMGRAIEQSNPTETSGSWVPSGDDWAGWLYTRQTYDWNGRPRITTNPDNTTKEASYSGCGCAGGAVVTLTDEGTVVSGATKKRQQRIYSDVLGRTVKTEVLNWDGAGPFGTGGSVYSATVNTYNARDQITQVRQFAGPEGSATYQDTTMTYDGYGRLKTKHLPEQNTGVATTWDYNPDDTIQKVTDARGVAATFGYNARDLLTSITYPSAQNLPAGITPTSNVTFTFDAVGNRTSMTDGSGNISYAYDQLSRLDWEERSFQGLSGVYRLNYSYNLGNQLTSLTMPFSSQQVGYNHDVAGRVTSITASGFTAGYTHGTTGQTFTQLVTNFASNITYRASGARKSMTYGNGTNDLITYNGRLQPTRYDLNNVRTQCGLGYPCSIPSANMSWTYDYHADSRLHHAYDLAENRWDRSYDYDHAARLKSAYTAAAARGTVINFPSGSVPYQENFGYDVWGNTTSRNNFLYGYTPYDTAVYSNNRRQNWSYDANGSATNTLSHISNFDAAGRNVDTDSAQQSGDGSAQFPSRPALEIAQSYDGMAQPAKRIQVSRKNDHDPNDGHLVQVLEETETGFYVRSSVMDGVIVVELDGTGQQKTGLIYAAGQLIAKDGGGRVMYVAHNPVTTSLVTTAGHSEDRFAGREEADPLGAQIPLTAPALPPSESEADFGRSLTQMGGNPFDVSGGCAVDGLPISCSEFNRRLASGTVEAESLIFAAPARPTRRPPGSPRPPLTLHWVRSEIMPIGVSSYVVQNPVLNYFNHEEGQGLAWGWEERIINSHHPQNPGREMAKFDPAKLKECVKAYGFDPNSVEFTPSQLGKGGSFLGFASWDSQRTSGIGVVNDLSYNSRQIGNMGFSPPGDGIAINGFGGRPDGRGFAEYSPYRNYTSSNLTNAIAIIAVQIHELGHSLSMITGVRPETASYSRLRPSGPDAGTFLERCVFGGEVGNNGRLYR